MSELRSVGVKGSAALYLELLRKCAKLICSFFLWINHPPVSGELFLLYLSALVSSKGHSLRCFVCWFTCEFSWLQISKTPFLSFLTCIRSLLGGQTTWLVRAVWHQGLRQRSGWHDDCIPSECQCPGPAESSSLPVDQGFLSCTTEWGWCDSAESGSCFCSSIESDPLAKVLPTFQLSAH